jgi:hypothetical protein
MILGNDLRRLCDDDGRDRNEQGDSGDDGSNLGHLFIPLFETAAPVIALLAYEMPRTPRLDACASRIVLSLAQGSHAVLS